MKIQNMDLVTFPIRIVLGLILFVHGLKKIKGMEETIHHFHVHLGLPVFMTYAVTFIEIIGGALLIVGLLTRVASMGIVLVMLGAILTVTWGKGFINGYEFNLALLAMACSLMFRSEKDAP